MFPNSPRMMTRAACSLAFLLVGASAASAQNRLVLPAGSVIIVRTAGPLESANARVGQTFETVVADSVGVDSYSVIPRGSRIRGVVTLARAATRQESGVMEVQFNRLTLADGTSFPIQASLTSTDTVERRQIESDPNSRVVLVGGRGGIGAAIAGAGSTRSSSSSILSALGGLLSEGRDVSVPSGTTLAVRLDQRLILRGRGRLAGDAGTIYTDAERIRAVQRALAQQNYYRGTAHGMLDDATQRALFEFQADRGFVPTGNLDGRTAQALGLVTSTSAVAGLSADEASVLRRSAQAMTGRLRQELAISTLGRLDPQRNYSEGDVDLWFALSAFADNASLYEQLVRASGNVQGAAYAGRALVAAARSVDAAAQRARPSSGLQNAWAQTRRQLGALDPGYGGAL